jgi:hypothetical protein
MQKAFCLKSPKSANNQAQTKSLNSPNNRFLEIMYIRNDIDQSVEVYESTVLDFNSIIENLNDGNSIFITQKKPLKNQDIKNLRTTQELRHYINHI